MRAALRALVVFGLLAGGAAGVWAAETLPPPPTAYFNDYAGLVSAADAQRLDAKLRQFAEQTSTQVVVAVFPSLPSPSLEDFTVRAAQSWRVGRKDWDNGAVFFVFVDDRKMRIETGYGLEGALPDQLAGRILDEQVRPRFRAGDWTGGLEAGIDGIMAATRGEYTAPPQEAAGCPPRRHPHHRPASSSSSSGSPRRARGTATWAGPTTAGAGGATAAPGAAGAPGAAVAADGAVAAGGGGFSGGGGSFGGGGASSSW